MSKLLKKLFKKENESLVTAKAVAVAGEGTEVKKNRQQPAKTDFKITLLTTSEGKIFLAGIAIAISYTTWLGSKFVLEPENVQNLVGITALEILFGRAASMAYGYSAGTKHSTIIPVCMILETILVLLFYPLFVFSWRHLLVFKRLKKFFDTINQVAVTHKDKVRKYGIIGLFAFVWLPIWMTGPMVGCVIGFLMALPAWLNLSVVLFATYAAIFCWAFFLHTVHQQVADYSPFAAMILMLIIVFIIILGIFLSKFKQQSKNRNHNNTV